MFAKGGDKFAKVLESIGEKFPSGAYVEIGFLADQQYPDGTSVAQVAWWQEFGTVIAPARPYFRPMIAREKSGWGVRVAKLLQEGTSAETMLGLMGEEITGELQDSIEGRDFPHLALSPVTLMLRKMKNETPDLMITGRVVAEARKRVAAGEQGATGTRARPLVDTGTLLRYPAYLVHPK